MAPGKQKVDSAGIRSYWRGGRDWPPKPKINKMRLWRQSWRRKRQHKRSQHHQSNMGLHRHLPPAVDRRYRLRRWMTRRNHDPVWMHQLVVHPTPKKDLHSALDARGVLQRRVHVLNSHSYEIVLVYCYKMRYVLIVCK